jgi:hypothetical protein
MADLRDEHREARDGGHRVAGARVGNDGRGDDHRAERADSDAFAVTVAPEPTRPPVLPLGSGTGLETMDMVSSALASEATVAAPTTGELPLLPAVSAVHYRADHEIARGGMGRIIAAEDRRPDGDAMVPPSPAPIVRGRYGARHVNPGNRV